MTEGSNNPPAAVLELNEKQAKFLLNNCNTNIAFVLNAMMADQAAAMTGKDRVLNRPALEKLIELSEQFKEIRTMLRKQGVEEDD